MKINPIFIEFWKDSIMPLLARTRSEQEAAVAKHLETHPPVPGMVIPVDDPCESNGMMWIEGYWRCRCGHTMRYLDGAEHAPSRRMCCDNQDCVHFEVEFLEPAFYLEPFK